MMKSNNTSSASTLPTRFLALSALQCKKIDTNTPTADRTPSVTGGYTLQRFFDVEGADPFMQAVAGKIFQEEKTKPFVREFVSYAGFPIWNHHISLDDEQAEPGNLSRARQNNKKTAFVPLVLSGDSTVNAILRITVSERDTTFKVIYRWQYKKYGYARSESRNNAKKVALLFMGMESFVFRHNSYKINDTMLFKDEGAPEVIKIASLAKPVSNQRAEGIGITICYQYKCPPLASNEKAFLYCETCETYWIPSGGGGAPYPPGTPGDSGGGGGDGGGNWHDNPCAPLPGAREVAPECQDPPGWEPEEPPLLVDDYELTSEDIRIFNEIDAEDALADESHYNKDCKGTLRGGNHKWPGTLAHWIIMIDYIANNRTYGEIEYAIPGSSANGNRGYADIVNTQTNEIFEIKKSDDIQNGATEVDRYVRGAKANCPVATGSATAEWRRGINYTAKNLPTNIPGRYLKVWLATSGVIAYDYQDNTAPDPAPFVVPQTTLDKLKTLVNKIRQNIADADRIIADYLRHNHELVSYIKSAAYTSAVAIIVGTIAEDFLTGGGGISNDWASFSLAYRIVRFAWKL